MVYTEYTFSLLRYGDDVCDRIWKPYNYIEWTSLSTSLTIECSPIPHRWLPSVVMSTAATPINDSTPFVFYWELEDEISIYYLYIHFAEVVKLNPNQYRSFNVTQNGWYYYGPLVPSYLEAFTLRVECGLTTGRNVFFPRQN